MGNVKDPEDDDAVGYKRPPRKHRFKSGQSGNPSGRPKKTLTSMETFIAELEKPILVNEGGKKRRLTRLGVFMRRVFSDAMAGDPSSRKIVYSWIERRSALAAVAAPVELSADDEAIIQAFLEKQKGRGDE